MLTAYKHSTNNDIVETTLDHSASWINVVEPDREEIEQLIETYNLPEDFIRDPLDADSRIYMMHTIPLSLSTYQL